MRSTHLPHTLARLIKVVSSIAMLSLAVSAPSIASAQTQTYLDRLEPVCHLRLDRAPGEGGATVTLGNGTVLSRPSDFASTSATGVAGPHAWAGGAWDFSQIGGPYLVTVTEAMSRMGNIETTDGFSVSFWIRGEYSGRKSRIMTGCFDIGTDKLTIWGGSNDYQNAVSDRKIPIWNGEWHHVAVVVDFKKELDNVTIHIDGALAGKRNGAYLKNIYSSVGRQWSIGARNPHDEGYDFGALADIAFFDRPLSVSEINYIKEGPVYAGSDQTITLPNYLTLKGFVPAGRSVSWQKISGADSIDFRNRNAETAYVKFTDPGTYVFRLSSGSYQSETTVTVLPNQAPIVRTGNSIQLVSKDSIATLSGFAEDTSIATNQTLKTQWTSLVTPQGAAVQFSAPSALETALRVSHEGLYTLRLTASDGELTSHADINVLVGAGSSDSYLKLLNPLTLLDFSQPAVALPSAQADAIGHTGYEIRHAENGLPVMIDGARPFTGYAWDFSKSDSDISIINSPHLKNVSFHAHPARSISFWVKGSAATRGYISTLLGVSIINRDGSFQIELTEAPKLVPNTNTNFLDEQWHHIALTLTTSDQKIHRTLYVDGVAAGEETSSFPSNFRELYSPDIRHAIYLASRGRSGKDNFSGQLDDFAIFDYALTPENVSYIYNGPSSTDSSTLRKITDLQIDAGDDQYIELPASTKVSLSANVQGANGLTPRWHLLSQDGSVTFTNPQDLNTTAQFTPVDDDKDGLYSKFTVALSLHDAQQREVARDSVNIVFYPKRAPAMRTLTPTPPAGVHPRILFTAEDLPELREKARTVELTMRANAAMHGRLQRLIDPKDPFGSFYNGLLNDKDVTIQTVYDGNTTGIFKLLSEAAYIAWIGNDDVSNDPLLAELAYVFNACIDDMLEWYRANHQNALVHDASWSIGLCYDLLYNYMDEPARDNARQLLSRMTRFRAVKGATDVPHENSSNWRGMHDHIILPLLAIEGEDGFDTNLLDSMEYKNANFLTQYGVFDSGMPHEGYAYYTLGMFWHSITDYLLTRREDREPIMETTRFYQSIITIFKLLDPNGQAIKSHHDVIGGETGSGEMAYPPRQLILAKYLWPEDRVIDYSYANLLNGLLSTEDRYLDIFHSIFGEAVRYPEQTQAEAAQSLDPVTFCPDRGFVLARNKWGTDAARFDFRCRMDKYKLGHQHSDVNTFEFWSHEREWIIDRGKFATTANDVHSTVLIDGISSCSSLRYTWPSFPGKFLEFKETDHSIIAAGDGKSFYDYSFGKPHTGAQKKLMDHGLYWSEFYYPRAGETMPEWMATSPIDLNGYGGLSGIYEMNPVKQAIRSVVFNRGEHPFVIIVDDIQKDADAHDYTWIANTVIGDRMEHTPIDAQNMLMHYKDDATSGPRLLVSVLEAEGQSTPITLERTILPIDKEKIEAVRIRIDSKQVVRPNFKVLLFPYNEGQTRPTTEWKRSGSKQILTVEFEKNRYRYQFEQGDDGRTHITDLN